MSSVYNSSSSDSTSNLQAISKSDHNIHSGPSQVTNLILDNLLNQQIDYFHGSESMEPRNDQVSRENEVNKNHESSQSPSISNSALKETFRLNNSLESPKFIGKTTEKKLEPSKDIDETDKDPNDTKIISFQEKPSDNMFASQEAFQIQGDFCSQHTDENNFLRKTWSLGHSELNEERGTWENELQSQSQGKANYFEGCNPEKPELLHSDSNFMFGPRYRTRPCDPTTSPIKSAKRPEFETQKGSKCDYDDNRDLYNREERDRKKSLSRLGLSSNKPNKRARETELNLITRPFVAFEPEEESRKDLSFGFEDSFPVEDFEESQKIYIGQDSNQRLCESFGKKEDIIIENEANLAKKLDPIGDWSHVPEPGGEYTTVTTEALVVSNNEEDKNLDTHKEHQTIDVNLIDKEGKNKSQSKKNQDDEETYSLQGQDQKLIENSKAKEIKRSINEVDFRFTSPVHQRLQNIKNVQDGLQEEGISHFMLEESDGPYTGKNFKTPIDSAKRHASKSFYSAPSHSSITSNQNGSSAKIKRSYERCLSSAESKLTENTKSLTYMQRKLQKISEENLKAMGDFEFKKTLSRLEKEKLEWQNRMQNENPESVFSKFKQSHTESPFMGDTKKHFLKIQVEKSELYELEDQQKGLKLSVDQTSSIKRPPLQIIQSEAEREAKEMQINNLPDSKNLNLSSHKGQKKRPYDAIGCEEEQHFPREQINRLKKVKKTDENEIESFEEMLSNSKKKLPKIQIEQIRSKEKEILGREQELKDSNLTLKDIVFKVDTPLSFKKDNSSSAASRSSSERKIEGGQFSAYQSKSLKFYQNCAYCSGFLRLGEQTKELICLHKTHMDCFNKMTNKKCSTCNKEHFSKSYLQR